MWPRRALPQLQLWQKGLWLFSCFCRERGGAPVIQGKTFRTEFSVKIWKFSEVFSSSGGHKRKCRLYENSNSSLLSRNAFNWDDQEKQQDSNNLGTDLYRFLLSVLWKHSAASQLMCWLVLFFFFPFLNMLLEGMSDAAVPDCMSWLQSCHFESAWQHDKINTTQRCKRYFTALPPWINWLIVL